MNKQYLIVAWRYLRQHRLYFFVNVIGLTVGVTVSLVLLLHVLDEAFYNHGLKSKGDIYQAVYRVNINGQPYSFGQTTQDLGPFLGSSRTQAIRIFPNTTNKPGSLQANWLASDLPLSRFFSLQVIEGNPEKAWTQKGTVILSEPFAEKLFPGDSCIGNQLKYDNQLFTVVAVVKELPRNSTVHFDILGSSESALPVSPYHYTLVMDSNSGSALSSVEPSARFSLPWITQIGFSCSVYLLPMKNMHRQAGIIGNPTGVWQGLPLGIVWGLTLLVIILITGNYTAMSTVQNYKRYRETGIRKILGASSTQVAGHFMAESFLMVCFAVCAGLIITDQLLPYFNGLTSKALTLRGDWSVYQWAGIFTISAITLIGTLVVPSVQLSSAAPVSAMGRIRKKPVRYVILRRWWAGSQLGILWLLIFLALIAPNENRQISAENTSSSQPSLIVSVDSNTLTDSLYLSQINPADQSLATLQTEQAYHKRGSKHKKALLPALNISKVLVSMSIAWAFICAWGLVGLAYFDRQKEALSIRIRRLAGASAGELALLVEKRYIYLALMSVLLMLPLAYAATQFWLPEVASNGILPYRSSLTVWSWCISVSLSLVIAATIPLISVYPQLRGILRDRA